MGPPEVHVLIKEMSLFQRLSYTLFYVAGTTGSSVLIREVSLFQRSLIERFPCSHWEPTPVPSQVISDEDYSGTSLLRTFEIRTPLYSGERRVQNNHGKKTPLLIRTLYVVPASVVHNREAPL